MKKDNAKNKVDDFDEIFESPKFKSNEILDEAMEERKKGNLLKAKKLAKKALEIFPDNIDADLFLAGFIDDEIKKLDKVNLIVEKAQHLLEKENMFDDDCVGAFWGIIETRPYMRARFEKMSLLYDLERNTEAIKECEDMLRLCESDNLGVRLILVSLYVLLEKFDEAEKLIKKYGVFSLEMKISLAIMYFKKGEYKLSKKCIKEIDEHNPFLACLLANEMEPYEVEYYSRGSEEEAIATLENMHELIFASPMFASFMLETLGIKLENEEY